ncbi:hypothetical protein EJB05_55931, partial [Eragrostis curvula]
MAPLLIFIIFTSMLVVIAIVFCPHHRAAAFAAHWWPPPPPDPPTRPPSLPAAPPARRRPPPLDPRPFNTSTAWPPAFAYNTSVHSKVTAGGAGEEAAAGATCSVCLAAFELGETVRLLPVCLHLFHVECIDVWLAAHSTCPICRSGTDPMMAIDPAPPV